MAKFLIRVISKCEIDSADIAKKQEYRSLSELVTILFAVIFGVGLSQLGELHGGYDFAVLFLGYLAVILSWWGYSWGIIVRPETNILNYAIDVVLIAIYWWLINLRDPLCLVALGYFIMFGLYWLWEVVRDYSQGSPENKRIVQSARRVNFLFFVVTGALLVITRWWLDPARASWIFLVLLYFVVCGYRYWIYRIYHPKSKVSVTSVENMQDLEDTLVSKAKTVAANAKAHLSGFRVGAAILSDTGIVYSGCNVEFDNYSNTIHAEEGAISAFIAAGDKKAVAIAVFTFGNEVCFPCGMCRQSLFEVGGKDMKVIACNQYGSETRTIGELLPAGFRL